MAKIKKFIKKAIEKPGSLSRQLNIPIKENIPFTLLEKIKGAPDYTRIRNPTAIGKRTIKATPLIKKRANLALILKRIKKWKRKVY